MKTEIFAHWDDRRGLLARNWVLIGFADLNSKFTMPLLKNVKRCRQEANSKYIPHQGKQECARRRRQNAI